ncbi:MAG: choice-of-anchor V domain-containing protein, partial [Bacteroidia bacterium]
MTNRLFSIPTLSVILVTASAFVRISSGGIVGVTGSPGETNCANCHGGGGGTTVVSITGTPAFSANQYNPGQTYTVNVTVANNSFTKFGFDCEVLTTTNTNAGSMTTALSGVQFANSGTRKNATQTAPKAGTGTCTFSFVWVAPASGTAKIFAAGNAVNNDGSTSGDTPGSANLVLTANATGVEDHVAAASHGLSVFPNPVNGDFRMQYTLVSDGKV